MFGFVKIMFIAVLASIGNDSNHTKCIFINNQQSMNEPILNNLYPNEYIEGLRYYTFAVLVKSFNELPNQSSNKISYYAP